MSHALTQTILPMTTPPAGPADSSSTSTDLSPLVTCQQAAKLLAISERTLWRITAAGEIPHVAVGRLVRYRQQDLVDYIDRQRTCGRAPERKGRGGNHRDGSGKGSRRKSG